VGYLHKHHLVPRVHGGVKLPTVMLCLPCHGLVHGRDFPANHSALTKAGMDRLRAAGTKFGNPNLQPGDANATREARAARTAKSTAHAVATLPYIAAARKAGADSLSKVAAALTARGIKPPSGGPRWYAGQVWRIERATVA
jgi:hypothetical protein